MKQTFCHFPITVRITGTLGDEQIEQLAAQVERAVTERIVAAEGELDRHLGSHGAIVGKPAGPAPAAAWSAPAGDPATRQQPTAAGPLRAPGGAGAEAERYTAEDEGIDLGGVWDELGNYWYTDDWGNTWIGPGGKNWKLLAGPNDATRVTPYSWSKADVREAQIQAAIAGIDLAEEKRATERLTGLEGFYADIKTTASYWDLQIQGAAVGAFLDEEEAADKKRAEKGIESGLRTAHFASVDEFDDAVRALRLVVRRRAVALALLTLKESEGVLKAELGRYYSKDECNKLATELAKWRRWPVPSMNELQRLLDTHRILMSPVAFSGALGAEVPEFLGEVLRQNAEAQLNNIAESRDNLRHDPDVVFEFDHIIDETLKQMGFGPTSVQAQLIREGRAKPERSWSRRLFDGLLLALSFASGPLGWIGLAARALILEETIRGIAAQQAHEDILRTAANTGGKGLASLPSPSGHGWELFNLFTAVLGVKGLPPLKADLFFSKARDLALRALLPEVRAAATVLPEVLAAATVLPEVRAGATVLPKAAAQAVSGVTPVADLPGLPQKVPVPGSTLPESTAPELTPGSSEPTPEPEPAASGEPAEPPAKPPTLKASTLPNYPSKPAFMDAMRRELLARRTAGNPSVLDFLLDQNGEWQKVSFISKRGRPMRGRYAVIDENVPVVQVVQAGHLQAEAYVKAFGQRRYYMIEGAFLNWESGLTLEARGVFSNKQAVLIDGFPVDIPTAKAWESVPGGLPPGTTDGSPIIEPPEW